MPQRAKSAALHLLEGNPNNKTKKELHKRQKNEQKLTISAENITAPSWLSSGGKTEFERIKSLFDPAHLLTDADVNLLAIYCDTLMDYKGCIAEVKKRGRSIQGKPNPFWREKQKLAPLLQKLGSELGLSPSARASLAINMEDDSPGDDDDDF